MKQLMYGLILVLIGLLLLSLVSFGCYRLSLKGLNLDVKKDIAILSMYGLFSFGFGFYLILKYFEERIKFK